MNFTTLLVANRGEIACRIFRSARAMGLRCVAVYVDADAASPHVADADEALRLPDSYLDGEAILAAARSCGADAIHPGYGFLAENGGFAAEVIAAGLCWVGPSPESIRRMGDKLEAKALADEAGVPTLPGSADLSAFAAVGFPLLVKAAAGGGGKGMRVVAGPDELADAIAAARREALGAFGDDRVFLERYVTRARHIEIQLLGDAHGTLVHLGERECSIQRRHQKILEESPSPRLDAALRERMGEAALRLGRALGYQSTGTVEFLLDDTTGEFFFLEVNTRLQVEHPVTEAVVGLDLVREQLRIARGEPLGYVQHDLRFNGAAIEARLYAEDPAAGFLPANGTLIAFEPADEPAVRWDAGVVPGSVVGTDFDPMLAKVIAHAPTRREAIQRLASALERLHLGGVTTNRDFLVATLRTAQFLAGETTTDFIDAVGPARRAEPSEADLLRTAQLLALWIQAGNRAAATTLGNAPSGWRNSRMPEQRVVLLHGERDLEIRYRMQRDGRFRLGEKSYARIHAVDGSSIDIEIDGRRCRARIARAADRLVVSGPWGNLELLEKPLFVLPGAALAAGGCVAPMPGKVLEVRVKVGARVRAGETVIVLEAMKMEHPMKAAEDGVVSEIRVLQGEQVQAGTVLLIVEPEIPVKES